MALLGLVEVIVAQGLSLVALWLRLGWRWHAKQEAAHHEFVIAVLKALPEDAVLDDERADGKVHRLTIARSRVVGTSCDV